MMKQGVKRLVRKSVVWKAAANNLIANTNRPSSSSTSSSRDKFCCLSREDVIPPSKPPFQPSGLLITKKPPGDPSAIAVVEPTQDGQYKIIGEISVSKLWKWDYLAAAWTLANLSAGQFVMGVKDNMTPRSLPDYSVNSPVGENNTANGVGSPRPRKFCSRSIGFNASSPSLGISKTPSFGMSTSVYRGRSAPWTCKITSSLAAVMAQMLSHRATRVGDRKKKRRCLSWRRGLC
ncbi:hypothetical protein Pint_21491 [Pistacia integerrima]|uniref:Uncharacterized protein n=1 Tax=Pistacia integerrima TaxID=434235 RepID=A0ACC0XBD9_9ROSI|nr:hypothetical protein Pint_21491 [Pistacia integerrima]